MSVYNLLSENDKELWLRYTAEYSDFSMGYKVKRAPVDVLLREWTKQKDYFLQKLFPDNLIFSEHICYKMAEDERINRLRRSSLWKHTVYKTLLQWTDKWHDIDWDLYCDIRDLLSGYHFYATNRYTGSTFSIPYVNDKGESKVLKIQKGCKLMKAIGNIYHTFKNEMTLSEEDFIDYQNKHSVIINDASLEGDLCFSIHPLDYVTASDNACDWSSCMNWRRGGEYHRGTIEMMNSPYVIVVYLTAKDQMCLFEDGIENWNSKKWRQFFIVTPDYIVPIKGYPYKNHDLEIIATNLLIERMNQLGIANGTFNPMEAIGLNQETEKGYTFNFMSDGAMYDDMGSLDNVYITYTSNCSKDVDICFNGRSTCIWCGYDDEEFDNESATVCNHCYDLMPKCNLCGCRDDELTMVDNVWLCDDCLDNHCAHDVITGELHLKDSMFWLHIARGNRLTTEKFPVYKADDTSLSDLLPVTRVIIAKKTYSFFSSTAHIDTKTIYVLRLDDFDTLDEATKQAIEDYVNFNEYSELSRIVPEDIPITPTTLSDLFKSDDTGYMAFINGKAFGTISFTMTTPFSTNAT